MKIILKPTPTETRFRSSMPQPWSRCRSGHTLRRVSGIMTMTRAATDDTAFEQFLSDMVFQHNTHADLLDHVGRHRLESILADRGCGYAKDLDRK